MIQVNIDAAREYADKLESFTEEYITEFVKNNDVNFFTYHTGLGKPEFCMLCISAFNLYVLHDSICHMCFYCIHVKYNNKMCVNQTSPSYKSYILLRNAKTVKQIIHAKTERAKYIRKVISELEDKYDL